MNKNLLPSLMLIVIGVMLLGGVGLFAFNTQKDQTKNSNAVSNTNAVTNTNRAANLNSPKNQNTNVGAELSVSSSFSYDTVKVGDRVGGMNVTGIGRVFDQPKYQNISPNYKISFSGEVTVTGRVQAYTSDLFGGDEVCVSNLDEASLKLVPHATEDTRKTVGFCFANADQALQAFPVGTDRQATFRFDDYVIQEYPSEVTNQARFISASKSRE